MGYPPGRSADEAPTRPSREVAAEVLAQADAELLRLRALERGELAALNAALRAAGVGVLGADIPSGA